MAEQGIVVEQDVMVPMRDDVALATDVFRPADDGPHPVLLLRTPYNKRNRVTWGALLFDFDDAVSRGYVVVAQDCRGSGASEGRFHPVVQERADGHDTIEWCAAQPWSNGDVGMWGMSYMGATTVQATLDAPAALKASLAYITAGSYHDSWAYVGGALEYGKNVRWTLDQATAQLARLGDAVDPATAAAVRAEVAAFWEDTEGFYRSSFDVAEIAPAAASLVPHWHEFLAHRGYDDYWAALDVTGNAERIAVPMLLITGWQDGMLRSLLDLHHGLVTKGPEQLRAEHRLIIGPWDHGAYLSAATAPMAGSRHFGLAAAGGRALREHALTWFDRWLRPDATPTAELAPVRYFAMGPDRWVDVPAWPTSGQPERWYLASGGGATTSHGDGRLQRHSPSDLPADTYVYDPSDPAPTVGGRGLLYPKYPGGFQDQRTLEARRDVVVYTSAHLVEPVSVEGPVTLELHLRTSGPTTDVNATLVDVAPDGSAQGIAEGVLRLDLDEPGTIRAVDVDLWDTAYTFPAGHRIRVHVTSSSFPRYERNRNVGPEAHPGAWQPAVVELLHDADHPSALVLRRPVEVVR